MEDKAVQAVRAKRDSTMRVGSRLVREGKAAAFISAGNTGAAMATAKSYREPSKGRFIAIPIATRTCVHGAWHARSPDWVSNRKTG